MVQAFSCSPTRRMGVLAAVLVLAGCGGGGGEEASAPAVPLAAAFANFVNQAASYQIAYAGTASTGGQQLPFSGSGAVTEATTASTFNSVPALRKNVIQSGQFQILGTSYPITATSASYFDTNYAPLGNVSDDGYCMVTSHQPLPVTARAGHSGIWFSSTCYSDASRTVQVGSASTSWVVESDTATSLRFKTTTNLTDNTGATGVSTLTTRVSTAGAITRLDESGTLSQDGVTLRYTGTYQ